MSRDPFANFPNPNWYVNMRSRALAPLIFFSSSRKSFSVSGSLSARTAGNAAIASKARANTDFCSMAWTSKMKIVMRSSVTALEYEQPQQPLQHPPSRAGACQPPDSDREVACPEAAWIDENGRDGH